MKEGRTWSKFILIDKFNVLLYMYLFFFYVLTLYLNSNYRPLFFLLVGFLSGAMGETVDSFVVVLFGIPYLC